MRHARRLWLLLFVVLLLTRLCHLQILWAEETLPMAAAGQMLLGKVLYRDIWFDKPPMLAAFYLLSSAQAGWPLRILDALYLVAVCWLAAQFARELWGQHEALWAAGLAAFYLIFDLPSAIIPVAADLLMVAPHIAAVYLAWRGRPFASGLAAGVAFLINPKGLFVAAACLLWSARSPHWLALGFLLPNALAALWLWLGGALWSYYDEVWRWGRAYAGQTFVSHPVANGLLRTGNWLGFHAAAAAAAAWCWLRDSKSARWRWAAWAAISMAAVAAGWRFFPRYYLQLFPLLILLAARGMVLLGRRRAVVLVLLIVPLVRFGPRYAILARDLLAGRSHEWADIAMDRDSRQAARLAASCAEPGAALFVWGFRPELYIYTGLPAASRFLDSQPLTGIPADRHLRQSKPVDTAFVIPHRAELMRTQPSLILDGLGPYNPALAIERYADLRPWLASYEIVGRTGGTVIYRLSADPAGRSLFQKR